MKRDRVKRLMDLPIVWSDQWSALGLKAPIPTDPPSLAACTPQSEIGAAVCLRGQRARFEPETSLAGSYKPSSSNFEYMLAKLKTLGIEKHQILHMAESMFHDHGPANTHGLASCWIFRRHGQDGFGATMHPDEMPKYDFRFTSMAGLVKAHQDALRG